jgi:hypothetical protein
VKAPLFSLQGEAQGSFFHREWSIAIQWSLLLTRDTAHSSFWSKNDRICTKQQKLYFPKENKQEVFRIRMTSKFLGLQDPDPDPFTNKQKI